MMQLATLAAVLNRPLVSMYSGPSEDKSVLSHATCAAPVNIIEDRGERARIQTADDYPGWAPASPGLTAQPQRNMGSSVFTAATAHAGPVVHTDKLAKRHWTNLWVSYRSVK